MENEEKDGWGEKRMVKRKRLDSKKDGRKEEEEEEEEEDNTPLRPIFCLKNKNKVDLERFDQSEDCYVLDFDDPFHSLNINKNLNLPNNSNSNSDISLVAEKGQLACRDYPHARYLCLKFPFHKTPIHTYCHMCYCYVCDAKAPCAHWMIHCHASHTNRIWRQLRTDLSLAHARHHHTR